MESPGDVASDSIELVSRARGGDMQALGRLLERHADRLRRIVRIRLGPDLRKHLESSDIVQETYLVAARRIAEFEPRDEASVLKWLVAIAINQIRGAHDHFTALKRTPAQSDLSRSAHDLGGRAQEPAATDTQPPDLAARAELAEIVDETLALLPEHYREAIVLRDLHGGDWSFVARELGAPSEEAAMKIYHRAWIRVRRRLRGRIRDA